jgi:HAD superfamily phosphoserine phosphatase-like hydrolase
MREVLAMDVGLFLDVDGVLTEKPVNMQYAQLLKVEDKLKRLERRWAKGVITNAEFNRAFIPIFQKAKFSLEYARKKYRDIQMREDARDLLSTIRDTTFIVTSGPSYFVDLLAKEYKIPGDRVLCSRYEFDNDGLIKACSSPSTRSKKAKFVEQRAKNFDISIGVGDTEQDIDFLSHCTVRVMTSARQHDYLTITQLQPIIDLVHKVESAANAKLEVRHLLKDSRLRARCEDILHGTADFDRAINQATLVLEDRIRKKVKASEHFYGERLVDYAYNEDLENTRLRVRSKGKSDQRGFTRLMKGVVPVFRNIAHHQIIDVSREEAARITAFIDLWLRVVDESIRIK